VADRDILKTSILKDQRQHYLRFRPKMLKHLQGRSQLSQTRARNLSLARVRGPVVGGVGENERGGAVGSSVTLC